jgi:hypothetical protein
MPRSARAIAITIGALAAGLVGLAHLPIERIGAPALPPVETPPPQTALAPNPKTENTTTNNATVDVAEKCKAFIGKLMGRPTETMIAQYPPGESKNIMAFVHYERDDGTIWRYQCLTDGETIVWRGLDIDGPGSGPGRWREEDRVPISSL